MDPRMAQRRRTVAESSARSGLRRFLMVAAVVGLVAVGLVVLRGDRFSIAEVRVAGAIVTDPASVAAEAGAVPGTPLIEVDLDTITERIADDPWVQSVSVARAWPDAIEIEVVERTPVAWVSTGSGWEHRSVDAVVLEVGDPGAEAPRIRGTAGLEPPVEASLRFVDALPAEVRTGMVVDARAEEIVALWQTYTIRLGRATDMVDKARALVALLGEAPPEGAELTLIAPNRPAILTTTTVSDDEEPAEEGSSDG